MGIRERLNYLERQIGELKKEIDILTEQWQETTKDKYRLGELIPTHRVTLAHMAKELHEQIMGKLSSLDNIEKEYTALSQSNPSTKVEHEISALKEQASRLIDDVRSVSVTNIHILTSTKGGVGKTLIGLGIVCSYAFSDATIGKGKILAVDINTMNIDLSRILVFSQDENDRLPFNAVSGNWWTTEINENTKVVGLDQPYTLHQGSLGFWEKIQQVVSSKDYIDYDVLFDTNVHIANLTAGPNVDSPEVEIIRSLIAKGGRIYIWIIWTWTAIKNSVDIKTAFNKFPADIRDKITLVHVLNPSAMISPQIDLKMVELWRDYRDIEKTLIELDTITRRIADLKQQPVSDNFQETLNATRTTIQEEINVLMSRPFEPKKYVFRGLRELARLNKYKSSIDLNAFIETLTQALSDFETDNPMESDYEKLRESFKDLDGLYKRPRNILLISTYDPVLEGYTDTVSISTASSLESIMDKIKDIQEDISIFLKNLRPNNS